MDGFIWTSPRSHGGNGTGRKFSSQDIIDQAWIGIGDSNYLFSNW